MKKQDTGKMIDRIIQLTLRLVAGERINIKDESIHFNVSRKTISMDLNKIGKHILITGGYFPSAASKRKRKYFYKE